MNEIDPNAVIKAAESLPIKEVYNDLLHPPLSEIGKGLQGAVKLALAPISGLVWGYEKIGNYLNTAITEYFTKKKIAKDRIKTPDPSIVGPAIDALRYTAQREDLREMFTNLIGASMDKALSNIVHSSFVEILKQMSACDAAVLKKFSHRSQMPAAQIKLVEEETNMMFFDGMPTVFAPCLMEIAEPFEVSTSLINLERLGLIEKHIGSLSKEEYIDIDTNAFIDQRVEKFQQIATHKIKPVITHQYFIITDFGKDFAVVVMDRFDIRTMAFDVRH